MAMRTSTILKRQHRRSERARKGGLATKAKTVAYQEPIVQEAANERN